MKQLHKLAVLMISPALILMLNTAAFGQDSSKKDPVVSIGYYAMNNQAQYVTVRAKIKVNRKFLPIEGLKFDLYLDHDSASSLVGSLTTNAAGEASTSLAPSLRDQWKSADTHTFIAVSAATKDFNESKTETPITKAKIVIDTADGRNITATVLELKNGTWTPVKAAEVKVAVKRMDADLPVSDKESYSTDSIGTLTAEFKRGNIPGDSKGFITLVAKIQENDTYGNLSVEQQVHWGSIMIPENNFNQRTLFATRLKTPIWLLFMAYSIFISAWSVIVYLIVQIIRIRKEGKAIDAIAVADPVLQ